MCACRRNVGVTSNGGPAAFRWPRARDTYVLMQDTLSTEDLLEQWREATRAAQLAERLAKLAASSVERADQAAAGAAEIAQMAERTAQSAEHAAQAARRAADLAASIATEARTGAGADEQSVVDARVDEASARDRYHEAERQARARLLGD